MQTITPNHVPWRYYNGAKSHTIRQRERLAFNEFIDRDSLKRPKRWGVFLGFVAMAIPIVALAVAGWKLGSWLAR